MSKTTGIILVILLLIALGYIYYQSQQKARAEEKQKEVCGVGNFLIETDFQAEQFRFDVNTPVTKQLKLFKKGMCIQSTEFIKRKNSGQEEKIVTYDGFDITEAGKLI